MLGFGGAFTDSTGINVVSLSETLQNQLLRSYFSPSGIEYNIGRIPIAGSDFSTYAYSYDEVDGDVDLEFFALTDEDFNYKIPLIQKAIAMSNKEIRLFGSPWSPPSWMKENGMLNGTGGLLVEMRDPFANYLIK
ncbi:UNVERIFIED_CONTAM: hypothetical protein GTU68_019885 [Idotea baltica]|nr:hypothetical protein [Idotea baltica]